MRSTLKTLLCALPALALIATALVLDFTSFARAAENAGGLTDVQKSEVRQIIKDYIRENPQLVIESFKSYQDQQQRDSAENAKQKIAEHKDYLTSKDRLSAGNPKGDLTVVEFFDYNCGYCKKAFPDIKKVIKDDGNTRFVFIEMPILSPTSLAAAQWAHAAALQGKYFEFHTALMEHNGGLDESVFIKIAKDLGLDVDKMQKDTQGQEVNTDIQKGMQVAQDIGIQGTPGFIVGNNLHPGYLGEDGLQAAIKEARSEKTE